MKHGSRGPEMVVVPAGEFKMGDIQGDGESNERPVHSARIQKPFAIGKYPVTFEEYDKFVSAIGQKFPQDEGWGRGRRPAINVSWLDAVSFPNGSQKRLANAIAYLPKPEWEYAARAGTETAYWWGNKITPAWLTFVLGGSRRGGKQTSPVGSFKPNSFGLCDTAGNIWEWVQDTWHSDYRGAPSDGSAWENGSTRQRVVRGGSWFYSDGGLALFDPDRGVRRNPERRHRLSSRSGHRMTAARYSRSNRSTRSKRSACGYGVKGKSSWFDVRKVLFFSEVVQLLELFRADGVGVGAVLVVGD